MELLLSPRAAVPWLPWQHRCIIRCLLMKKQPRLALRYLQWIRPGIESTEDAKLCADVLLQNRYIYCRYTYYFVLISLICFIIVMRDAYFISGLQLCL